VETKKSNADSVLICTDRAARGVDFDAAPVDHVVIFDFPKHSFLRNKYELLYFSNSFSSMKSTAG
jgi:superfamily II DNA/RNA helicase